MFALLEIALIYKALKLFADLQGHNLAKSMWDNTLQSNRGKLYLPPESLGWRLLPLMFSYFKNFLAGHLWRRPGVLCVWILWLVLRLLYSLSTSCSTKGRICGTRNLLSAIPMTSHLFWLSVTPRQLDLKINKATLPEQIKLCNSTGSVYLTIQSNLP